MRKEYKYILWDIDDTLIDFHASESFALRKSFDVYGVSLTDEDIAVYSGINRNYWEMLERGEIEKGRMLERRFEDLIEYLDVADVEGKVINVEYQLNLGDCAVMYEHAYAICSSLKGVKKQYAITNGTVVAQERKLLNTGLDQIFDGVFISDKIGHQKPDVRFFDSAFAMIPDFKAEEAIVIGDSLSSDMKGANNAGVDCCWFNPRGLENVDTTLQINYEVSDLRELLEIIS